MLKIAVLLTGHVRLNHDVYENINFFLKNLTDITVDFFCTTWYEDNVEFKKLNEKFKFKILDIESCLDYSDFYIQGLKRFKNFCLSYNNDDDLYKKLSYGDWERQIWRSTPFNFYKLNRGFNLIEEYSISNNIEYDLIIRLRWDCLLRTPILEQQLINLSKNNKFCVFQHDYMLYKQNNGDMQHDLYHFYVDKWIDDLIFISNFNTFKTFSKIYYQYQNISDKYNTWIIHLILRHYLNESNINIEKPSFKISLKRKEYILDIYDYLISQ